MVAATGFRVGLMSDDTLLLEGQEIQGKLNEEETLVLIEYLQDWLEGPDDEDDDEEEEDDEDSEGDGL